MLSVGPVETVLDIAELVGPLEPIPCDFDECDRQAVWYMVPSCGCEALAACTPCKAGAMLWLNARGPVKCRSCYTDPVTVRWERVPSPNRT